MPRGTKIPVHPLTVLYRVVSWVPCEERLPTRDGYYLVYPSQFEDGRAVWFDTLLQRWSDSQPHNYWMIVPPGPEVM